MSYPKYGWVGNRIAEADMAALYKRKKATRKSITAMVAEAVSQYVKEVGERTHFFDISSQAHSRFLFSFFVSVLDFSEIPPDERWGFTQTHWSECVAPSADG